MEGFGFGLGAGGGPLEPIIEFGRELAGVEPVLALPRPFGLRPFEAATGGGARLGAAGAGGGGADSTNFKLIVSLVPS